MGEPAEYRPMLRVPVHQTLRVKLHAQQERQRFRRARLLFKALNNPVTADGGHPERRGNPCDSLVMRAIHT